MKVEVKKWTLGFFLLTALTLFAQGDGSDVDLSALRDWVNTKRQVTVKERGGNLSISGEVRSELQVINEQKNGVQQRGSNGATGKPMYNWDIEVNLLLDYRTDRTWTSAKIKFDNNASSANDKFEKISVDRALFGATLVDQDTYTIKMDVGRRSFGFAFDSKIEFGSSMDGILFQYDYAAEGIGNFYIHGGPFLIDENYNQYGYVTELGLLNMGGTGLYSKLSAIVWDTKDTNSKAHNDAYRFIPVQWIWGYKFIPQLLGKMVTLYAAGLYNTVAKPTTVSYGKKAPWAWYAGFSAGELKKQWDWSLDVNYQYVQMQAIPDFDGSGIGRGNTGDVGLYTSDKRGKGTVNAEGNGVGAGNYKGFAVNFLWLATSNITIYQSWQQSINQNKTIKPDFSYKRYEIELIYAF